ncbi:uncharacterized protein N7498_008951 [Penicillium cinerascens]|uniref:Uncharacterized protein n=1 Tax=Penicillium cinerascens TaxID=70096 RepID=A0A9W9JEQ7_9EURO|nr:uncharacterized protein N7498_008951 [Penicillium cinerascens]KAJ5195513.1 hypothetical protein N7498_008951 [Penicillium cinerascens]
MALNPDGKPISAKDNGRRPRTWWKNEIERVMLEEEQSFAEEAKRLRQFGLVDGQSQAVPSSSNAAKETFPDWK